MIKCTLYKSFREKYLTACFFININTTPHSLHSLWPNSQLAQPHSQLPTPSSHLILGVQLSWVRFVLLSSLSINMNSIAERFTRPTAGPNIGPGDVGYRGPQTIPTFDMPPVSQVCCKITRGWNNMHSSTSATTN